MSKMRRACAMVLCLLMMFSMIPAVTAQAAIETRTVKASAVQLRRMWCQTDYNTDDYVYGDEILFWARVLYTRFLDTKGGSADGVERAVVRLQARAAHPGETVHAAAVAISDAHALATAESDLKSATQTLRYYYDTATAQGVAKAKLVVDKNGNYLPAVADSVAAYGAFTASVTPVTGEKPKSDTGRGLTYEYPVTIELDVTDTYKAAMAKGQNVQFVIMMPKDVYVGPINLASIENFGQYKNGKVYLKDGFEYMDTVAYASLDQSKTVCGGSGYYTGSLMEDEYFDWVMPLQNTMELEISTDTLAERFVKAKEASSAAQVYDVLKPLRYQLAEWASFEKVAGDEALGTLLLAKLRESASLYDFAAEFDKAVLDACWQGYTQRLLVDTTFGGTRGRVRLEGKNSPAFCYIQLEGRDGNETKFTETLMMRDGVMEYNVFDKREGVTSLRLTATADKAGARPLTGELTVNVAAFELPSVFISQLSNQHTLSYFSDWLNGTYKANNGEHRQKFQYIELYNYSDKTVDLTDHRFVYNDNKGTHTFEWILEEGGSMLLKPHESYVIGVYAADTVKEGLGYNTSEERTAYWDAFNAFYNCDIPVTNRVMIACVQSGDGSALLDGINHLERSKDAKVTCSAQIKKGDQIVTEAILAEKSPASSSAFYFAPDESGRGEKHIFSGGCFPYGLKKEQQVDYCEETFLGATEMLKVCSYNILATEKSASDNYTNYEIEEREDLVVKYIQKYDLDIIGLQEVNYRWIPLLKEDMPKIGYSCVQGISSYGTNYSNIAKQTWHLMNPIYYKTDRFTELEQGHAFLTQSYPGDGNQWDSGNLKRTLTWVTLKDKKTGEIVSFLNTHLVTSGAIVRSEQVKLVNKKAGELQKKYGGGVIITGDHNMAENSLPYHEYINGGVVRDSKYATTNRDVISANSDSYVINKEKNASSIDLVMTSDNYVVNQYCVYDGYVGKGSMSDHPAIYVELFNGEHRDTDEPVITGVEDGGSYCEKATFSVSDANLVSVTLDGKRVEDPTHCEVLDQGEHTLVVTEISGRTTVMSFTVAEHDFVVQRTEATCIAGGQVVTTCKRCDYYDRQELSISSEHLWKQEYTVDVPASCAAEGSKSIHCEYCNTQKQDSITVISATGEHDWDMSRYFRSEAAHWHPCTNIDCDAVGHYALHTESKLIVDTPASCDAAGVGHTECTVCTMPIQSAVVIPATGNHTAGAWTVVKEATTKAEGLKEQRCTVCNTLLKSEIIAKKKEEAAKVNFTDVKKSDFFFTPVQWAVANGVTTGTSKTTFGPNESCTRAQAVTFLWRAAGQPAPKSTNNPFKDVKKSDYYYKAVLWAAGSGVTSGTGKTEFSPNDVCTRGQIVTFLWRAQGQKKVTASNPFIDVKKSDFYYNAVLWAVKNNVTAGTSKTTFEPNANCTRGQIVTFLYRAIVK